MRFVPRFALAALAGAITLTGLAATPAMARTSVTIAYHDRDRYDYRDYRHDRRDRHWRGHDRHDRRYYSPRNHGKRCWTEWRYDRRYDARVKVRYCR